YEYILGQTKLWYDGYDIPKELQKLPPTSLTSYLKDAEPLLNIAERKPDYLDLLNNIPAEGRREFLEQVVPFLSFDNSKKDLQAFLEASMQLPTQEKQYILELAKPLLQLPSSGPESIRDIINSIKGIAPADIRGNNAKRLMQ